ncbi:MAG: ferritin family protein [Dehalococcoidales bacterium]
MVTERSSALKALETAIHMEMDGQQFYLEASRASKNELGRQLFTSLAAEEDLHRKRFEEIYQAIRQRQDWPGLPLRHDHALDIKTIFAPAVGRVGGEIKAAASELEAIQVAMYKENKSYDFYEERAGKAVYEAEKEYYQALAAEERHHYLVLVDYQEYLSDPATWFTNKEHPSLDGG